MLIPSCVKSEPLGYGISDLCENGDLGWIRIVKIHKLVVPGSKLGRTKNIFI